MHALRVAASWLASFVRSEWRPEHYPIVVREHVGVPDEARWFARVLNWPGPVGLGPTRHEARSALEEQLRAIASHRRETGMAMPRPGTSVPVEFASTARVSSDPTLLSAFVTEALGFAPGDPVFISDETTIGDFGDDERVREIRERVRERFGVVVDVPEPVRVADVLDEIRERRSADR